MNYLISSSNLVEPTVMNMVLDGEMRNNEPIGSVAIQTLLLFPQELGPPHIDCMSNLRHRCICRYDAIERR